MHKINTASWAAIVLTVSMPFTAAAQQLERIGEAVAGQATEISIAGPSGDKLLTAMRESSGHLEVIRWSVATDGAITRYGSTVASDVVTHTALDWGTMPGSGTTYWVNAVVSGGWAKAISWKLSGNGPKLLSNTDLVAGASECDVATLSTVLDMGLFAVVCQIPTIRLMLFAVNFEGHIGPGLSLGDLGLGTRPRVAYAGLDPSGKPRVLSAFRDANGKLKVFLHAVGWGGSAMTPSTPTSGNPGRGSTMTAAAPALAPSGSRPGQMASKAACSQH